MNFHAKIVIFYEKIIKKGILFTKMSKKLYLCKKKYNWFG